MMGEVLELMKELTRFVMRMAVVIREMGFTKEVDTRTGY